ncbi:hypothetical protein BDF21DRAFT_326408, partial [Thamnidium elegans]
DRGTGCGSRTKDHLRYRGKWKEKVHGQYTNVCITDEYNTSRICVYCFSHLDH